MNAGDVALRRGGSIRNDFRFFRCEVRVATCHFDSTTGLIAGDAEPGVGGFDGRLPGLRLPAGRVISIPTGNDRMTNG